MNGFSELITSKDNPAVKLVKKLIRSKKERAARKEFVLEGVRLVMDAIGTGADIRRIFVTQSALEKYAGKLPQGNVTLISDKIGEIISDTESTQGIFAVCGFVSESGVLPELRKNGKYAVLSGLQDPGNAGMIIRTADALGLDGVIFSGSCDIYNPKTVRSTMGSLFRVPVYSDISGDDVFTALEKAGLSSFAAVVSTDAQDVKTVDFSEGGAVFIGNEGNGLATETVERCNNSITIRMNGNIESLNAAMAAGIIMWELTR